MRQLSRVVKIEFFSSVALKMNKLVVFALFTLLSSGQVQLGATVNEGPVLKAEDCYMPEGVPITKKNSSCEYTISSAEGHLANITFTIEGAPNAGDIFEMRYLQPPGNMSTTKIIFLVLKDNQILDYETQTRFDITVLAEGASEKVPITVYVYQAPVLIDFPSIVEIEEEQDNTTLTISGTAGGGHAPGHGINTLDIVVPTIDREMLHSFAVYVEAKYYEAPNRAVAGKSFKVNVIDIDDNPPKIKVPGPRQIEVTVPQNATSVFVTNFTVSDPDQDQNSAFSVSLSTPDFQSLFQLSASSGVGEETFDITVDPTKVHDSDGIWNTFVVELHAKGVNNENFEDSLSIIVTLNNPNSASAALGTASAIFFSILVNKVVPLIFF
ncbi:protocadherin beta-14-like isoform X2 [Zophobas morio]|uniref:protocadherin beta-14-like isoform X2 n=1 Tax=Zophobas morio TaxID=2755281 RepID=UPI0030828490